MTQKRVVNASEFGGPSGYYAEMGMMPTGLEGGKLLATDGRLVASVTQSSAGWWSAQNRGSRFSRKTLGPVLKTLSEFDAEHRQTPGQQTADHIKSAIGLYDNDRVLDGYDHIGQRIVERIFESANEDDADLHRAWLAACAWEKHVLGGRISPIFRGTPFSMMKGSEVADIMGEMVDAGLGNVGEAERWFSQHANAIPEPERTQAELF